MIRFSKDADAVLDNGEWNDLYRLELREHFNADFWDRQPQQVNQERTAKLVEWGLIVWSEDKGRHIRTRLGRELSQLFS